MAEKKYKLKFQMTDGTEQSVQFSIPYPNTAEIVAEVISALPIYGGEVEEVAEQISFTIDGKTYQAEEGMTWAEWCDSQYNNGQYAYTFEIADEMVIYDNGYICWDDSYEAELPTNTITSGHAYVMDWA